MVPMRARDASVATGRVSARASLATEPSTGPTVEDASVAGACLLAGRLRAWHGRFSPRIRQIDRQRRLTTKPRPLPRPRSRGNANLPLCRPACRRWASAPANRGRGVTKQASKAHIGEPESFAADLPLSRGFEF